jgi:crotonobetainyl-CoA:carnitine CoA-transferase CaiB-like acyl-CoA transferase
LPATAVNTPAEVLTDPHFLARDSFVDIDHPVAGTWKFPGAPFRLARTPWQIRQSAPLLGQHTEAVLKELLKFSDAEMQELRERQII